MRTAVSLALLLGVLGAGTAGAAYLLQRRSSPVGTPSAPAPSPSPTSPSLPTVGAATPVPTVPVPFTPAVLLPAPPITTLPVAPVPAVLSPVTATLPVSPVWQLAGSTHALQYASDSILARLKDPSRAQWPGGTPAGLFDEHHPFPLLDR